MSYQSSFTQGSDAEGLKSSHRPLRVDPNRPLSSQLPSSPENGRSPLPNGVARTASRRRKPTGSGPPSKIPVGVPVQPPAPEVPKAPPVSFRPPYDAEDYTPPRANYPSPSFAERARALTGNSVPTQLPDPSPEPFPQPVKPVRRGSLNRPIGGLYSEIQQHKRDSYPPPNGPISPRRFSYPTNPQQHQGPNSYSYVGESKPTVNQDPPNQNSTSSTTPQTSSRLASASVSQSSKRGWAPDRSPLQKLEVKLSDISKEEKRARVQEAEQRLRDSQAGNTRQRSGQGSGSANDPLPSRGGPASTSEMRQRGPSQFRDMSEPHRNAPPITGLAKTHPFALVPGESGPSARSGKRRQSLPDQPYPREKLGTEEMIYNQQTTPNSSQRTSVKGAEMPQVQQPGRGVRFQGQDGAEDVDIYSSEPDVMDRRYHRKSSVTEALAKSDEERNARRNKIRQDVQRDKVRSSSEEVPTAQQELQKSRVDELHKDASAATYGGVADPVSRNAVKARGEGSKYEIPPQTAAGVRARQLVGFDTGLQGAIGAPAHRKHHLADILHRSQNHAAELYNHSSGTPRRLDEWRRAGTARLTAADFGSENESEKNQGAWWEGGGSGSRRKSGRTSNKDSHPHERGYQAGIGKFKSPFSHSRGRHGKHKAIPLKAGGLQTRPYLGDDEYELLENSSVAPLENHVSQFLYRSGHDQTRGLSSAYLYSCPNLAVHNPSHENHICEPYLSKELTQSMRSIRIRAAPEIATFNPPLYLKCGPLLRYTGLKRDRLQTKSRSGGPSSIERETWRGSIMIVTADADSDYDPVPTLRLFSEPMDILPAPSQTANAENVQDLPPEYVDPIAGLPKLSRSGKTVYVKPVDDLEHSRDLSRLENDDGLFEETRTAAVPTAYGTPDFRASSANPRPVRREERSSKRGQLVKGVRLHAERGVTFWRFNLEVELGAEQTRIGYSINNSPSVGFWVPARGHSMNAMFHSCNGFSMSVNPNDFSGPDPLWRDVLNCHQTRPFHVMIGGGDQVYNDAVMSQSPLFREWLEIKNPHRKHEADFTPSLREELETFYLERYSMWFSQGLFGMANSQIPMVNMWDDHDIIDGFGSYPHHFMSTPVFCGLGAVAFKYYMLFQHQSVPEEGVADEPSWLMGAAPGPYINEMSRSVFVSLGKNIALLALDCRTERMREEILSEASYDLIFDRCRREIVEGETKHLIVLLGIPIAYPRLVWLENLLTSKVMDPVKYLGRAGILGGFLNKFDGGVEILDDLDDHWTAKNHKYERNWLVQELQELAAEKSVRVTILGQVPRESRTLNDTDKPCRGDVHLAAVGQFHSNPKLGIRKDKDHRYMANVVSSAIVNTPPPNNMADILNRRNKTHHLDQDTDEDMIPMFTHDVNGNPRNNKRLLPRRNWCSIREYHPGSTPPPTPPSSDTETESEGSPLPQTRLQRTLSLTRSDVKPGNLIRRLSGRMPPPSDEYPPGNRYDSGETSSPDSPENDGYFPRQPNVPKRAATVNGNSDERHSSAPLLHSSAPLARPGNFHRRPTNMSEKAVARGNPDDGLSGHINLEHGLDIVLNCEVNQKDPAGITVPYRLLVPALFYEGHGDENIANLRKRSLVSRLTSIRGRNRNSLASRQGPSSFRPGESATPSDSEGDEERAQSRPRRWSFGVTQRRQYRDQTPPSEREIGEEGTQKGRQFEHRSQQIGKPQKPFSMPPSQQKRYGNLDLQTPTDGYNPGRGDSVDYHQHLDPSPPGAENGYPGRRPSKVDRMLGVANLQRNPSAAGTNMKRSNTAGTGPSATAGANRNSADPLDPSYESDDYSDDQEDSGPTGDGKRVSHGYSGINAYSEKKGWRKWLDKAREWEEKSSGRRDKIIVSGDD